VSIFANDKQRLNFNELSHRLLAPPPAKRD